MVDDDNQDRDNVGTRGLPSPAPSHLTDILRVVPTPHHWHPHCPKEGPLVSTDALVNSPMTALPALNLIPTIIYFLRNHLLKGPNRPSPILLHFFDDCGVLEMKS